MKGLFSNIVGTIVRVPKDSTHYDDTMSKCMRVREFEIRLTDGTLWIMYCRLDEAGDTLVELMG